MGAGAERAIATEPSTAFSGEAMIAKLKETGSVEAANVVYEENRRKLYSLALQATGSKEKAKELAAMNRFARFPVANHRVVLRKRGCQSRASLQGPLPSSTNTAQRRENGKER